jgi:hypothetical protein
MCSTEVRAAWLLTLIAASVEPRRLKIGTAIERSPSSSSWSHTA